MKVNVTLLGLLAAFTFFLRPDASLAQGCVAIRNMGCSGTSGIGGSTTGFLQKGQFQVFGNYRYFKSFRHFRGSEEQLERLEENTEVINKAHSIDLGLAFGITDRLSVSASLPVNFNDRSSLYEHYGNPKADPAENPAGWSHTRFHTGSKGIGDLRVSGTYWLFDPAGAGKGNLAVGLGVKLPTGDAEVKDDFHKLSNGQDTVINKLVDQSIQLGDGGWGGSVELQGYHSLFSGASAYFSGFYMLTPQEHNDVARRDPISAEYPASITNYFAVPDQFAARLGMSYAFPGQSGLVVNLGGRAEGVPAKDLVGGKEGYRRPGYVVSVEPGVSWFHENVSLSLNVPFAVYRNRVKSVSDDATGGHGDAAFADYLVSLNASYRFGGKQAEAPAAKQWKDVSTPKQ